MKIVKNNKLRVEADGEYFYIAEYLWLWSPEKGLMVFTLERKDYAKGGPYHVAMMDALGWLDAGIKFDEVIRGRVTAGGLRKDPRVEWRIEVYWNKTEGLVDEGIYQLVTKGALPLDDVRISKLDYLGY